MNKIRLQANHHRAAKRNVAATRMLNESLQLATRSDLHAAPMILKMVVEETLNSLPDDQRVMIRMRTEGHSVADIAAATGRSKRSVERLLQHIRARLSRSLFEEPASDGA
jgi:DNA-directed RNA polymerase specialized sigma24 family protein